MGDCDGHINDQVVTNSRNTMPCRAALRTVIVKDNLPPVITLEQRRNIINSADGSEKGSWERTVTKGEVDHACVSLMAESTTSSANAWVIGSIASAVTGLALLGLSTRRAAVATSVPV